MEHMILRVVPRPKRVAGDSRKVTWLFSICVRA